jgi:hypothetical protein
MIFCKSHEILVKNRCPQATKGKNNSPQRLFLSFHDGGQSDYVRFKDEEQFLRNLLKETERQHQRTIRTIYDANGSLLKSSRALLHAFAEKFKQKYDTIPIQIECMGTLLNCNISKLPDATNEILEEPISLDELYDAVKAGKPHKASGSDGITQEFFKSNWEIIKEDLLQILKEMYGESQLTLCPLTFQNARNLYVACPSKRSKALLS